MYVFRIRFYISFTGVQYQYKMKQLNTAADSMFVLLNVTPKNSDFSELLLKVRRVKSFWFVLTCNYGFAVGTDYTKRGP